MDFLRSSVRRIAKHDLRVKFYRRLLPWFDRWCHFTFQSCFNKLRGNVNNEITLICAKFGADVVNTCKVTSSKTKWPVRYTWILDSFRLGVGPILTGKLLRPAITSQGQIVTMQASPVCYIIIMYYPATSK